MRRLKSLFRRTNPNSSELGATAEIGEEQAAAASAAASDKKASTLKEDDADDDSMVADPACLHPHHGRSRIGTETSVENPTCIENPGLRKSLLSIVHSNHF